MTYEEFREKYKQAAHEKLGYVLEDMRFYPKGYTSDDPERKEWIRDSNMRFVGESMGELLTDILTMDVPDTDNVVNQHRIAIHQVYERYLESGFDEVFADILEMHKETVNTHVDVSKLDARSSGDYQKIKDQLILRPLNYGLHMLDLKGHVYKKVGDFVLCLYQVLQDTDKNLLTSKIKRAELKEWGVSEDKVMQDALENTARLYPAVVLDRRTMQEENFLEGEFTRDDILVQMPHSKFATLSTKKQNNGAVSLFYPGVIDKMMKIMGGPFQAVFANTTDVLIFDKTDRQAVQFAETAKGETGMGEMLSGRVYLCDGREMIPGIVVKVYPDGKATVE